MTKIIQFPKVAQPTVKAAEIKKQVARRGEGLGFLGGLLLVVWMLVVLVWPLLRWLVALDVFWQLCRMAYYWNTPGVFAGWQFLAHFAVLTALHYYVGVYRPRGAPSPASRKY